MTGVTRAVMPDDDTATSRLPDSSMLPVRLNFPPNATLDRLSAPEVCASSCRVVEPRTPVLLM